MILYIQNQAYDQVLIRRPVLTPDPSGDEKIGNCRYKTVGYIQKVGTGYVPLSLDKKQINKHTLIESESGSIFNILPSQPEALAVVEKFLTR